MAHYLTALQLLSSGFALLGTWLLRKPGPLVPWGFVCWLVSNPAAMLFMALHGHWLFFAQHLAFLLLALEGVWQWLVKPRLEAVRWLLHSWADWLFERRCNRAANGLDKLALWIYQHLEGHRP